MLFIILGEAFPSPKPSLPLAAWQESKYAWPAARFRWSLNTLAFASRAYAPVLAVKATGDTAEQERAVREFQAKVAGKKANVVEMRKAAGG